MRKKRKFVYFLGAGASFAAGASASVQAGGRIAIPTQALFWSTFLRFCESKESRRTIEGFLFRYFLGYAKAPSRLDSTKRRRQLSSIDVEEVFTFLSERVRSPSTSPQLRTYSLKVWTALVSEIGNVFGRFGANTKTRSTYHGLLEAHIRRFDAVVSFNYDTVFEDSLPASENWAYEGVQRTENALPVLKPHGSVNWQYNIETQCIEVNDHTQKSVVVAPTHLKFVSITSQDSGKAKQADGYLDQCDQIQDIWSSMEEQMKAARALVFIGYSFPIADLYFSSVLRSVLADRDTTPDVVIVNPDAVAISERLTKRFSLDKVVRYFDLAQFVQASRDDVISQLNS